MATVNEVMEKYGEKLEGDLGSYKKKKTIKSKEYEVFRKEFLGSRLSWYEMACNRSERIVGIRTRKRDKVQEAINQVHLNITPEGAASFASFIGLFIAGLAILFGIVLFAFSGFSIGILFLIVVFILLATIAVSPLMKLPIFIADRWRLKASNQMVLCILYVMMYMRHTSNLEHAVTFAADHIGPPLALDLRKVVWDVETGKYSTIKQSLDNYLQTWRKDASEFIESFHLIESSLLESTDSRRLALLDKSLEVMLDGTYQKMLHFSHELKNPIQMLHMLGVVLPILGLVLFPLIGSLLGGSGSLKTYLLFGVYNIFLPAIVFFMGLKILSKRPTGYSAGEVLSDDVVRDMKKIHVGKWSFSPFWIAAIFILFFTILGFSPLIMHALNPNSDFIIAKSADLKFYDYKNAQGTECTSTSQCFGPFGVGATLMSLLIILSIGIGVGWYFKVRTKKLIKIKDETRILEKEFSSALFQLGNRIGDGIPAEAAFGDVANSTKGSKTSKFFGLVHSNVLKRGMTLEHAIFDKKHGAIYDFPSKLIESSMKILVETSKKGSKIVSKTLTGISTYISNIQRANERLKDLMAEVTSSMKSQVSFLTPIIAGIVVGIGIMVVTILGGLQAIAFDAPGVGDGGAPGSELGIGPIDTLIDIFNPGKIVPSFFFQLIVGLYVLQVVYILSYMTSVVENGPDRIREQFAIGKNLKNTTVFYFLVSLIATLLLTVLVVVVISGFK